MSIIDMDNMDRVDRNPSEKPTKKSEPSRQTSENFKKEVFKQALKNAETIITKSYLEQLDSGRYQLAKMPYEKESVSLRRCGSLFRLERLAVDPQENILDKLMTVVNVVSVMDCSLAVLIKSDGKKTSYYFGMVCAKYQNDSARIHASRQAFEGALTGNLQGMQLDEVDGDELSILEKEVFDKCCCCSISGIAAQRDAQDSGIGKSVQGIENLADALKGRQYTILLLADPVAVGRIREMKQGYELLHTQLSEYSGYVTTYSKNETLSLAKSRATSAAEGITKGIALTQGTTENKGWNVADAIGVFVGGNAGVGIGPVNIGMNMGKNKGKTAGVNFSTAEIESGTKSVNMNIQLTYSESDIVTEAVSEGTSVQTCVENRSIKSLLDKIDLHLERLDACESFGAFECAAYVIADKKEDALAAAANYYALMRGKDSCIQASQINLWDDSWDQREETGKIRQYLKSFTHPRFYNKDGGYAQIQDRIIVTPASVIGGNELALQIGLPQKSVRGVTVLPMAAFGRNVPDTEEGRRLHLGKLRHMGHDEGGLYIPVDELCRHTFITGVTGAGKSTAIYSILEQLRAQNVHFMVIEPAKGEYKDRFGNYEDVKVYGTNYKKTPLIRLNPFSFPDDVLVLEHIERLVEIFNVCWPMYAAMPAVLKDAVEEAYVAAGWDLETSECKYTNRRKEHVYPTFTDVLDKVQKVMERSSYSKDTSGDYIGALCTRLKSLTNGLYRNIFTYDEIPEQQLFEENVIVDLSRTGSAETKALLMGILVMKLQEYRSSTSGNNQPLRHVTVLEEAHHLLKRTSNQQSMESANLAGKSVEMLAESIAEMRTYGEGFLIADQAPGLMDLSAIRNTGTKVILRLPDQSDRELAGRAAGLNEQQLEELARIENYVAAVHQNGWMEPVLCHMKKDNAPYSAYHYELRKPEEERVAPEDYIRYLVMEFRECKKLERGHIRRLKDGIWNLLIPVESKIALQAFIEERERQIHHQPLERTREERHALAAKAVYDILNTDKVSTLLKNRKDLKDREDQMFFEELRSKLKRGLSSPSGQIQLSKEQEDRILRLFIMEYDEHRSSALERLMPKLEEAMKG